MGYRADLVGVVEAAYDLRASETEWLQGVADACHPVLKPDSGLLAYHVDFGADGFRIHTPVQSGDAPADMVRRIEKVADLLERVRQGRAGLVARAQAKAREHVIRAGLREPASRALQSEFNRVGPSWMYNLGAPVQDVAVLLNHHVDGNGFTGLFGGLKEKRSVSPGARRVHQMLSAHIKAGLRLRRRWGAAAAEVKAPSDGAVLSGSGEVLHAEGDARTSEARRDLCDTARRIDRARSKRSGRGEEALAVWQGLVDGRWSLVEAFEADGKRIKLAHENDEQVRDPRGLSEMESRVVGLAVRGYSDKLIAYHLGIAEGTASSHLACAMRKLGIRGRAKLVAQLGCRYPQGRA